jgi:uncharacterized protein YcfJ
MNPSITLGAVAAVIALGALGALAGHQVANTARVVSSVAQTRTVKVAREQCHDEAVTHTAPVRDPERVLGAALGGILGHQVGSGRGTTVATVAGIAAGGYAGNQVQKSAQAADQVTTTERRCATVYDRHVEPAGFEVVYDYRGERHHVHLDHDPGATLPVVDGKVAVSAATSNAPPPVTGGTGQG